jgi:hypothetical protein
MFHSTSPISIFAIFITVTLQASQNPIPLDEKAAKAQARELKSKILQQQRKIKTLYKDRASKMPEIKNRIEDQVKRGFEQPMMKVNSISREKIEASKEFLRKTTVQLPKDEEQKYEKPHR